MFKKYIVLSAVALIMAFVLYACKCSKEYGHYIGIYGFYSYLSESEDDVIQNIDTVTNDTLFLSTGLSLQCIAQTQTGFNLLNTVQATSIICPCGESGFHHPPQSLTVYANTSYGSYIAGADVTSLFTGTETFYDSTGKLVTNYFSPNLFASKLVNNAYVSSKIGHSKVTMFLTQKPADADPHSFKVQLTTADTVYTFQTDTFRWM